MVTKLKRRLLLYYIVFISTKLFAQVGLPQVIPASPETALLLKFLETPVSHYAGLPVIEVPLYTISEDQISIPIKLSYHAGGIRVNEVASSVGLGWNLFHGGQISRIIKGRPDENSYLTTSNKVSEFIEMHNVPYEALDDVDGLANLFHLASLSIGGLDYQPDEFVYSFLGYSGKFVFNQDRSPEHPYGELVMLPENDLKINPVFVNGLITSWEITTPDGIKYIFGMEIWDPTFQNSAGEFLNTLYTASGDADFPIPMGVFTGWNLKRIVMPNQKTIDFEYVTSHFFAASFDGETQVFAPTLFQRTSSPYYTKSYSGSRGRKSRLSKIKTNKEELIFTYGNREDAVDDHRLNNIVINDYNGIQISKIVLNHSYFTSNDTNQNDFRYANGLPHFTAEELQKRLKLTGVDFLSRNSNDRPLSYQFTYNEVNQFPNRFSYAQDAWGYFNGKNNSGLLPKVRYRDGYYQGTGNRTIDTVYAQTGMLTGISYPGGASTSFLYESNEQLIYSTDLFGLEYVLGTPFEDEGIVMVKNNWDYMDRRQLNPQTNLYKYSYVNGFTIPDNIQDNGKVDFTSFRGITGDMSNPVFNIYFEVLKKNTGPSSGQLVYSGEVGASGSFCLEPGNYVLKLFIEATYYNENIDLAEVQLKWKQIIPVMQTVKTGGQRIKEIRYFDGGDTLPKKRIRYSYPLSPNSSFLQIPMFVEGIQVKDPDLFMPGEDAPYLTSNHQDGLRIRSNSVYPLLSTQGSAVSYLEVMEELVSPDGNSVLYENRYTFSEGNRYNLSDNFSRYVPYSFEWTYGNPKDVEKGGTSKVNYQYSPLLHPNPNYYQEKEAFGVSMGLFTHTNAIIKLDIVTLPGEIRLPKYTYRNGAMLLTEKITTNFEDDIPIEVREKYSYETNSLQPTKTEIIYNDQSRRAIDNWYSGTEQVFPEFTGSIKSDMENRHMKKLIKSVERMDDRILSTTFYDYKNWGSGIVLPQAIQASKGTDSLEEKIVYHDYDVKGNPLELSKADGTHIVYIWGYQKEYPIAKIEHATFTAGQPTSITLAQQNLINAAVSAADGDVSPGTEDTLRIRLKQLREGFPDAMVTTYTYDPLVGMTSMTDAGGKTVYYGYDGFNRLEQVRDASGNVLSRNEYNYKN